MVERKFGEQLYIGILSSLASAIRNISESVESAGDENFLEEINNKWINHNKALNMIQDVLLHMDKNFIKKTQGTKTIHEIGFRRWMDSVIGSEKIRKRLPDKLVQLVLSERKGEVINTGLTGKIIKMLMDLGMPVYEKNFKKPFLLAFDDFYGSESQGLINSVDCENYLMEVEKRMNEEWGRVSCYLDPSSESTIIRLRLA
ncbi:cullin-3A [Trifolium repens]|nr:cullin-3A [Trifolium repens]